MNKSLCRLFMLLCICLLGALSAGWATTRTVPAPRGGGLDDTANIQAVINQALPGDTVNFQSGASYSVAGTLNLVGGSSGGTVTYAGTSCTLNYTGTTAGSMVSLASGVSYISFSNFTLDMSSKSGNFLINSGCSYLTVTNNTFENDSYSGGAMPYNNAIFGYCGSNGGGLANSAITYNTFENLTGTSTNTVGGIFLYAPNAVNISDNTFSNIPYMACINIEFTSTNTTATGMVINGNSGNNNLGFMAIQTQDQSSTVYPSTTNLQVENNAFTVANSNGGTQEVLSIVNRGKYTTVSNNTLSSGSTTVGMGLEINGGVNMPTDATITNNIVTDIAWGMYVYDYNDGDTFEQNLFDTLGSGSNQPFHELNTNNEGGAADIFQNNWLYGCTTSYTNNANLSGSCPTMSITGAQNGADGVFTITSNLAPSQNTAVTYAVSGTGIPGTDYTALSGTATILAGQTSVTVPVTHLPSNHGNVTVIASQNFGPYYRNGSANSATVTINTNSVPTVTVAASPTSINEKGGTSTYTVTRTGATTSALVVNYAMSGTATSGTDYTALSGSLTIASGSTTGTVTLTAKDRYLLSGSKTAILTISSNATYTVGSPSSATVTINDNDSNPISTTNLMLWLRADVGVTKNGGNQVSSWADQSGNSMTATGQGTTDPLWVNNALNGFPVMQFDGASNYFSLPSGFANFTAGTSIFVVATPSVVTFNSHFLDFSAGTANDVMSLIRESSSNDLGYYEYNGSWAGITGSGAIPVGSTYLLEFVQASSGSATLYKNATALTTATIAIPTNATRTGNYIAKSDSSADALYEGNIAEVIVYNTALSATNRQAVESYLRAKYANW